MSRRTEVEYQPGSYPVIRDLVADQLVRIPRDELTLVLGELRQISWQIEDERES